MMRNGVIGSTADSDSVSRGSSPFSVAGNLPDSKFLVERYVRDVEAAGSNPVTPIHPPSYLRGFFCFSEFSNATAAETGFSAYPSVKAYY